MLLAPLMKFFINLNKKGLLMWKVNLFLVVLLVFAATSIFPSLGHTTEADNEAIRMMNCICGNDISCKDDWYQVSMEMSRYGVKKIINSKDWKRILLIHYNKKCAAFDIPGAWYEFKKVSK